MSLKTLALWTYLKIINLKKLSNRLLKTVSVAHVPLKRICIQLVHIVFCLAFHSWLSQSSSVVVVLIQKVFDVFGINPSMVT